MTVFTHPDVLGAGVREGWADPQTDPTRIDWAGRQQQAAIWFEVVDNRPVNPFGPTAVRYGRNELGHWGEAQAGDAFVTATTAGGQRWLLLVERGDGYGWALPGGMAEPGEDPGDTARRELIEETGLALPEHAERYHRQPRYVPDPRCSDEAWIVTTVVCTDLGHFRDEAALPQVAGADDARRAAWLPADSYPDLVIELEARFDGRLFPAHHGLLLDLLDGPDEAEAFLDAYIDQELADRDPGDLRHLAEGYLRLVSAIEMTMADLSDWDDDQLTEVERLTRYLAHLAGATRGACDPCGRVIFAPHHVTGLPAWRWWHPQRWRQAIQAAWTELRWGGRRMVHTSCLPRF